MAYLTVAERDGGLPCRRGTEESSVFGGRYAMGFDAQIETALASCPDFWQKAREAAALVDGPGTLLPGCRALPPNETAGAIGRCGRSAYSRLLVAASAEPTDTARFRNAVYLLLYFDSLFVYRELKSLYPAVGDNQRPWLAAACRKILIRCLDVPESADVGLTREIVRNTEPGRLSTTPMIVELSQRLSREHGRPVVVRDMAVSDGITTLDLAMATANRSAPVEITGTDLHILLQYAGGNGNQMVSDSSGHALQYEVSGRTFGLLHDDLDIMPELRRNEIVNACSRNEIETITMLAPEVESAVASEEFQLRFKEENAFEPDEDVGDADIIRVANLFVERTADHRGYYCRGDILRGIRRLGSIAKDGACLFLDNFRKRIEHIGLWRKNEAAGRWERLPVEGDHAVDLAGIRDIPIDSGAKPT